MLLLLFATPAEVEPPDVAPFWYGYEFGGLPGAFVYGALGDYQYTETMGGDRFDYIGASRAPGRQDIAVQRVAGHLLMLRRARLRRR